MGEFVATVKGQIVPVASYAEAAPLVEAGGVCLSDASTAAGCLSAVVGVRDVRESLRAAGMYGEADKLRQVAAILKHCLGESGIVTSKGGC